MVKNSQQFRYFIYMDGDDEAEARSRISLGTFDTRLIPYTIIPSI